MGYAVKAVAELLRSKDYSPLFADPRFRLLVDPNPAAIEQYILENYQPVLSGGIRMLPLRARTEADTPRFTEAAYMVNTAISVVSGDYSVQAYFGIKWFSNILRNLIRAEKQDGPIPSIKYAAITAAGPSLDIQLPLLEKKRSTLFLIATDTSLPTLLHAGLEPDAVVSIDCQHISYYHFMEGLPAHIPLYLDLASPPGVASRSAHPRFFSGGHPLTRYISQQWRAVPLIDTSGGNVTYAAMSLADMLGAERIELYGADFSYPQGRTYARGTYIYPFFEKQQTRFSPLEALFSGFLFRSPQLQRFDQMDTWYYETPILNHYRKKLEEKIASIRATVIPVPGIGARLCIGEKQPHPQLHTIRLFAPGSPVMKAQDFLAEYREKIRAMPAMHGSAWTYLQHLSQENRLILSTLLPQCAMMKRRNPKLPLAELIESIRSYCLQDIDKVLNSWSETVPIQC
jgi:hypothetical protein